ncbi:MAG: HNH endonuclease [Spirochaetaceae bacterium]|jgi:hypothetical protein|nr:HNH endonuclease [Spirochaetaceae bacterium]
MEFELSRPIDYSDEALLAEIRRVALLVDKPLSGSKFDKNSKYSFSTIQKRFGGWKNALEKAGLDDSYIYNENEEITKDRLINELHKVAEKLGRKCFSEKEFEQISHIWRSTISKKFGYFNKLMNENGFSVPLKGRKYTDEERYENLLTVWTYYGRQPTCAEMKKEPSKFDTKTYIIRWGSWRKALLTFLDKVNGVEEYTNGDEKISKQVDIVMRTKENIKIEDRHEIPIGLRYKILKRDNFRCSICGRSPATTLGLELHVDHIIPFSKSGKTVESNLRTLCSDCNIGKGNSI